jgi:DNA-binding transcriptional regulator YiaG
MSTGSAAATAAESTTADERRSTLSRHVVADARSVGLRVAEIGEIAGVGERAVQNWSSGKSKPDGASRDRLLELKYVIEELSDVYTPEGIEVFLHSRQRALDGMRPIDVLRDGNFETVLALVDRLAGGPRR